jgi:hypothetical protein
MFAECKNSQGILGNETLKDAHISISKMPCFFFFMIPIEYHEKKIKIKIKIECGLYTR